MDWRESVNCQNCVTLNKKLELFDLLKQKCCKNDDIIKNLLSLKKAYEKSTKVLESKSKKLVEVRNKLEDAGKTEENLKRKVAEFQLRLVSSDTKYQEVLKDIENEQEKFISLTKAKGQLEDILQSKENELASLVLISKQSEERHGNEIENLKSELAKIQVDGVKFKEHRQNTKKLEKLEEQLHLIFKGGLEPSKENLTKLKRIINRISAKVDARKLEVELNSPSLTPDGTPSLDTGIFSEDEDFANPSLADDLNVTSDSDDDFEDVEQTMKQDSFLSTDIQKVQNLGSIHLTSPLPLKPNCDNSTSRGSKVTPSPSKNDFACNTNVPNSSGLVGSPLGQFTNTCVSNETDSNIQTKPASQDEKYLSPVMESSETLPDLLLSEPVDELDVSLKIPCASPAQNLAHSLMPEESNAQISNVPNLEEIIFQRESSDTLHQELEISINSPLKAPAASDLAQTVEGRNLKIVERVDENRGFISEDHTTGFQNDSCHSKSPKGNPSEDSDSSPLAQQSSESNSKGLEEISEERNLSITQLEDTSSQDLRSSVVSTVPSLEHLLEEEKAENVESVSKHQDASEFPATKEESSVRGLTSPRSSPLKDFVALSISQKSSDLFLKSTSTTGISSSVSSDLLCQSLANIVKRAQDPVQICDGSFEELNTRPRNNELELASTTQPKCTSSSIVNGETYDPVLCTETSRSPSKSLSTSNLIDENYKVMEDTKDPESTFFDSMLDEWKSTEPILPFSDDSCGFDDESLSASNGQLDYAPSSEESNPCELANERSVKSTATNTEEICLISVASSPIAKFKGQSSPDSSFTFLSGNHSKESGISTLWSRMDKAVSPMRKNFRDVGVMPIKELRKDVAISPLKISANSAGTSPMRGVFKDSAVSPIRVKGIDVVSGSVTVDKSTQVNLNPKEISQDLEEKMQPPEWSQDVKLLRQTLEALDLDSGDLASVVTDENLVKEIKKMLEMAFKKSCHSISFPSREPEFQYERDRFCQYKFCEFAEICNQQHRNLHLLAKSKHLEKKMCSSGKSEKYKVKRLKRIKPKKIKNIKFTEETFNDKKTQFCGIVSVGQIHENLESPNHASKHSISQKCSFSQLGTSAETPVALFKSTENQTSDENPELGLNSQLSMSQNQIEPSSSCLRTAKSLNNSDGKGKSSSFDSSLSSDEGKLCEIDNTHSPATLKTTSTGCGKEIECEGTPNKEEEDIGCAIKNDNHKSTSSLHLHNDNSLSKTSRKRASTLSESSCTSVGECEASDGKTAAPIRRSPRIKKIRVAHNFDSGSRYSYQKGYVKFVKGETVFVSNESETLNGPQKLKSNLAEGEINNLNLRVEENFSEPLLTSSSLSTPDISLTRSETKGNGESRSPISHAFEKKIKNSNLKAGNGTKRTAEDQVKVAENRLKRHKQSSPKMSSDEIDDTDDDRLVISYEADDNEQDKVIFNDDSHHEKHRDNCVSVNLTSTDIVERNLGDLSGTVSSESGSRSTVFDDTMVLPTVSQGRPKVASGKPSKLQRLRSSVSKVHPLAQTSRGSRCSEEAEDGSQVNERMKKIHSGSASKDDQVKLRADILEKLKGRESVRMAAAASGRTAQLIELNSVNSVRQKTPVARCSLALGPVKPVKKTTSVQPLVRPEDRLLCTENSLPLKNRKCSIRPKKTSALVEENPPEETFITKDIQQSSFLITDDIDFCITNLGPLAYAINDRQICETPHCNNKNGLKNTEQLVRETLKNLVAATSFTPDVLQRAIDALSNPDLENVLIVLVRDVVKMMDDDYDTPPLRSGKQEVFAPPLTPVQQQLLTLVLQLSFQHQHLKQLPHEILRLLEYRMFRLGKAPEGPRLQWCSSFYASICRVLCLRSEALIFCWDALYTLRGRSYDVVKVVMDVWPHLFPINPNFEKACPNAQVMLHLLKCHVEKPPGVQQSNKFDNSWLKRMLRCTGLQSTSINSTLLSSRIFSSLIDGKLDTNVAAMVLLAKREEEQWTMKNVISGNFLPALAKWQARLLDDVAGERVIWTMCSILRALPPERNGDTSQSVLKLLTGELLQKDNRSLTVQMQEVIAIGLALLSKHDIESVAHSLLLWNPSHGSSKGYSLRLLQYLSSIINSGSRPRSWWQSRLNQRPKLGEE